MGTPRHPRRHRARRAAKWAGAVLCVLIFVAWFASRWSNAVLRHVSKNETRMVVLSGGRTAITWLAKGPIPGLYSEGWSIDGGRTDPRWVGWDWMPERGTWLGLHPGAGETVLPLYIPFALLAVPTAWLFYLDRRRFAPGRCQRCGYDLAGLAPGAVCPECGKGAVA
jgi:hypothetical protein